MLSLINPGTVIMEYAGATREENTHVLMEEAAQWEYSGSQPAVARWKY